MEGARPGFSLITFSKLHLNFAQLDQSSPTMQAIPHLLISTWHHQNNGPRFSIALSAFATCHPGGAMPPLPGGFATKHHALTAQ
jgi:hypothetical protein